MPSWAFVFAVGRVVLFVAVVVVVVGGGVVLAEDDDDDDDTAAASSHGPLAQSTGIIGVPLVSAAPTWQLMANLAVLVVRRRVL